MGKRQANQPIQVLVVEATRGRRELLTRLLQNAGGFAVAGTASDGPSAIEATCRLHPDIIIMDVRLPSFDGYEVTRQIMQRCPTPIVLMSGSTGDARRRSVEALSAGALAVVRRPDRRGNGDYAALIRTLRLMADVPVVTRHTPRLLSPAAQRPPLPVFVPRPHDDYPNGEDDGGEHPPLPETAPHILAIAASTGGPAAIQTLLNGLRMARPHDDAELDGQADADVIVMPPILIAQHIARGFVNALAEWLRRTTLLPVHVAHEAQHLLPGHVYLAADGQHLLVGPQGTAVLLPGAERDRYCPSADVLFESVAQVYGARALGVVLTGMGDDGARGLWALRAAGGQTFAQDEASSVVYGMPQAAVAAGAVASVAPLTNLAEVIVHALRYGARTKDKE